MDFTRMSLLWRVDLCNNENKNKNIKDIIIVIIENNIVLVVIYLLVRHKLEEQWRPWVLGRRRYHDFEINSKTYKHHFDIFSLKTLVKKQQQ